MRFQTPLTPKDYRSAAKERMGSYFAWGSERFTGWFLGKFFYVTHHAGYEWNRRITNQKNVALGYVKETENGSEVRFILFQGMLCPQILIPYLLFFGVYLLFLPELRQDTCWLIFTLLFFIGTPLVATCIEISTQGSIDGRKSLLGLLIDPTDYFACLHHQNEIR